MSTRKFKNHLVYAVMSVKNLIDTNPCQVFSNGHLASSAGICRNILQDVFKDHYGADIGEYKLKVRMQEAKHLLRCGYSIKKIAIELHYSSSSAFTNAFKNHFTVTPTEWMHRRKAV